MSTQTFDIYRSKIALHQYCPAFGENFLFSQKEKNCFGATEVELFDIYYSIYFLNDKKI